jgi:hypothetical protein
MQWKCVVMIMIVVIVDLGTYLPTYLRYGVTKREKYLGVKKKKKKKKKKSLNRWTCHVMSDKSCDYLRYASFSSSSLLLRSTSVPLHRTHLLITECILQHRPYGVGILVVPLRNWLQKDGIHCNRELLQRSGFSGTARKPPKPSVPR